MRRKALAELGVRMASAAVLLPLVLVPTWTGGWPLALLLAASGWQVGYEWFRMHDRHGLAARVPASSAAVGGVGAYCIAGPAAAVAAAVLGAASGRALLEGVGQRPHQGLLGVALLAVPLVLVWELRELGTDGRDLLLWCLLVVWSTDTFAFLCGRALRGRLLAPAISPGKTWSGLFGGILAAGIAGGSSGILLGFPAETAVLSAVGVGMATITGDLVMSAVKRTHGRKDTGRLIPGHGGILDRIDGLLLAVTLVAAWKLLVEGA